MCVCLASEESKREEGEGRTVQRVQWGMEENEDWGSETVTVSAWSNGKRKQKERQLKGKEGK